MIEIIKTPASDKTASQVLTVWFNILLPKWAKPAIIGAFVFFLTSTIVLMVKDYTPSAAWLALTGLVVTMVVMVTYMPVMVFSTLKRQKQIPSYHEEKRYCFYDDHMTFSSGGSEPINIPLNKLTRLYVTKIAVLFTIGNKLVFWIPTSEIPVDQLAVIITSFENSGVETSIL